MIKLILGHKGSGKTKKLVELVNAAAQASNGNVVCVEKESQLTYDVTSRARLTATDTFSIQGYSAFYGFLCGICAGDHDITDIFVDATLRIGGRDYNELAQFLAKVNELSKLEEKDITFTVSADKEEIPASVFEFAQVL
ncbi:MAG TPA: hypothetical protein DDY98_01440 [Ruminococcaceae bacterium]|nr:hypothetical protein [Oscillospiraceae bacterium]